MKQKLPGSAGFLGMIVAGFAVLAFLFGSPGRAQERGAAVYVMIWFDTEDYILPESNDAAKRLAVFLSQRNIRGTFKLVGEKARMLQRLGRQDVIAALGKHEIGYHTNFHSQHPTPSEYLEQMGWEEGIDEFDRRERSGFQLLASATAYASPGRLSPWRSTVVNGTRLKPAACATLATRLPSPAYTSMARRPAPEGAACTRTTLRSALPCASGSSASASAPGRLGTSVRQSPIRLILIVIRR